jgi:two-component system cell cycle response regulator CtrA
MRILLVDTDGATLHNLGRPLRESGAMLDQADTGREALELLRHYDYDLVVLELMLPDIEGYEVLRRMRAARMNTPVLVLSALSRPEIKVRAFSAGADDILAKPFDRDELLARIQAVIRRSKGFSKPDLRVGCLELNLNTREVKVNGREVALTSKEYVILELLMLRKGMALSREVFLNHLYNGMDEPEMKVIDVFVCKLRKKLAQAGAPDMIGTIWGRGYVLREPSAAECVAGAASPDREARPLEAA